jgi:hypothetical protein
MGVTGDLGFSGSFFLFFSIRFSGRSAEGFFPLDGPVAGVRKVWTLRTGCCEHVERMVDL